MLFRPSADQNLVAVQAALEAWNFEADRLREAAIAAREGGRTSSLTTAAVEDVHDGLMSLLEELDEAFDKLKPGSQHFAALLQAQTTAAGLLESVGNSFDILQSVALIEVDGPTHIVHESRVAAE